MWLRDTDILKFVSLLLSSQFLKRTSIKFSFFCLWVWGFLFLQPVSKLSLFLYFSVIFLGMVGFFILLRISWEFRICALVSVISLGKCGAILIKHCTPLSCSFVLYSNYMYIVSFDITWEFLGVLFWVFFSFFLFFKLWEIYCSTVKVSAIVLAMLR